MDERKYQPMFPDNPEEMLPDGSRLNPDQSRQLTASLDRILGPSVNKDKQSKQLDEALAKALGPDTDAIPVPGKKTDQKLSPEQDGQISNALANLGIESSKDDY